MLQPDTATNTSKCLYSIFHIFNVMLEALKCPWFLPRIKDTLGCDASKSCVSIVGLCFIRRGKFTSPSDFTKSKSSPETCSFLYMIPDGKALAVSLFSDRVSTSCNVSISKLGAAFFLAAQPFIASSKYGSSERTLETGNVDSDRLMIQLGNLSINGTGIFGEALTNAPDI